MEVEIINNEFRLDIFGRAGVAVNKDYAATAFSLMDKVWPVIKASGLKHRIET